MEQYWETFAKDKLSDVTVQFACTTTAIHDHFLLSISDQDPQVVLPSSEAIGTAVHAHLKGRYSRDRASIPIGKGLLDGAGLNGAKVNAQSYVYIRADADRADWSKAMYLSFLDEAWWGQAGRQPAAASRSRQAARDERN